MSYTSSILSPTNAYLAVARAEKATANLHTPPTPREVTRVPFGPTELVKFEVGKVYWARSICDHECIFRYQVVSRTKLTITIKNANQKDGKIKRCALRTYCNIEQFKPHGNYSMAAVISADKVV